MPQLQECQLHLPHHLQHAQLQPVQASGSHGTLRFLPRFSIVYLRVLPLVASAFAFTACCCCLPFRRPCKSLCRLRPTTPHQGVTWAQGRLHRCTLVGVLPRMGPPCLMDLQCRRAMAFLSSLGVRRIHMDMVVAYRWGAPTGRCKWPGHLHILVDL